MAPRGRGQGGGRSGGRSGRSGGRWFPRSPWARIKREEDKTATSNSARRSSMQIMADKVEQAYQAAKQERRQKLAAKKPRPLEKGEVIIISSDSDWDDEKAPPNANAKDESSTTTTFRVIKEQQLASASTSAVPSPLPPDEEVEMKADAGMEGIEQAGRCKEEEQSKLEQQQPAKRKTTAKKLKGAKLSIAEQNEYDRKRCNALPPAGKFLSQPKFLTLNPYAGVNEMRERDCFFNDHLQFLGEIPHSSLTELFVKYMKLEQ